MIRKTVPDDQEALFSIIRESGQFDEAGMAHVAQTFQEYVDGESEGLWFTADDGEPVGVAYCAPEPVTSGTWNLLMLWVRSGQERHGHGSALVANVEEALAERGARLLIVETSGLPEFETARNFYAKAGFTQEARVRDFFEAGDDKLIYTKSM